MKRTAFMFFLWVYMLLAGVALGQSGTEIRADYHQWSHIKSMVIEEGHPLFEPFGGIHHIYANKRALTGYRKGKFPDGSILTRNPATLPFYYKDKDLGIKSTYVTGCRLSPA